MREQAIDHRRDLKRRTVNLHLSADGEYALNELDTASKGAETKSCTKPTEWEVEANELTACMAEFVIFNCKFLPSRLGVHAELFVRFACKFLCVLCCIKPK